MTATAVIQTSLYSKLTGDSTLMALLTGGVFDFQSVPPATVFPYLTIGDMTEAPMDELGRNGYITTVTLHVYSKQPGTKECQAILARLNVLLNKQPLVLTGKTHVGTWYEFNHAQGDPSDDRITHLSVRYRIQSQEP